jgi:pheromone shutdown protein TraB
MTGFFGHLIAASNWILNSEMSFGFCSGFSSLLFASKRRKKVVFVQNLWWFCSLVFRLEYLHFAVFNCYFFLIFFAVWVLFETLLSLNGLYFAELAAV